MKTALKWVAATFAVLVSAGIVYIYAISVGPYQKVATELRSAPEEPDSALVAQAVVVVEDPAFLENTRFTTLKRIVETFSHTPGRNTLNGGSTISTQLVRRVLQSRERRNLIAELVVIFTVDALWPKTQVLSAYLRGVYLGSENDVSILGFASAATAYFGKPLNSLSIAETALLAALIKSPSRYSPTNNPARSRERRNKVLESLKEDGTITEQEYSEAILAPLPKEA